MSEQPSSSDTDNPSMVHGHAAYVVGAAKETIGSLTSTSLQETGASEKSSAVDEMRAAKAQADAQGGGDVARNETLGKVEKTLGGVTGCEGMEEEGGKRMG